MTITTSGTSITFNDATVQTTSARTGATVTSSATDITLTATSNQLQQVAMTAQNKRVILPNATTYASGALGNSIFVISNNGSYPFDIAETGGGRLFVLSPGQTTSIGLSNNSASSTGWVATPVKSPVPFPGQMLGTTDIISYEPTNINSTIGTAVLNNANTADGYNTMKCCALSATSVVVVFIATTTLYPTAVAGSISGTTITWGTPVTLNAVARGYVQLAAMSSTTALVTYTNGNDSTAFAVGLTVSGTTITVGTSSSQATTVYTQLGPLTSTTALSPYANGSNNLIRVITSNGVAAPTYGTAVTLIASTKTLNTPTIVVLSATSFVAFYNDASSNYFRAGSVSGTTITLGTQVTATNLSSIGDVNIYTTGVAVSATEALFYLQNGAQFLVTVSGTTISSQSLIYNSYPMTGGQTNNQNLSNTTFNGNASNYGLCYLPIMAKISATDALLIGRGMFNGTNFGVQRLSISAATLAVGEGFSITCNMPFTRDICALSSTQAFLCGLRSDVGSPGTFFPTGMVVALNG
jgi:hypothetical protein